VILPALTTEQTQNLGHGKEHHNKHTNTRVNQKVKAIFKLHGNWDREELAHCAILAN